MAQKRTGRESETTRRVTTSKLETSKTRGRDTWMSLEDLASFTDSPRRSPHSGGDPSTKTLATCTHKNTVYRPQKFNKPLSNTGRETTWTRFVFSNSDFASHVARGPPGSRKYVRISILFSPYSTIQHDSMPALSDNLRRRPPCILKDRRRITLLHKRPRAFVSPLSTKKKPCSTPCRM